MATVLLNETSEQRNVDSNIQLFPHQKAILQAMINREMAPRNETLVAILGDTPGSGKSYPVLGLILLEKLMFKKTQNLFVVPASLHQQWIDYIHKFSSELTVQSLMYYSDVTDLFHDARVLSSYDILITTPFFYRMIAETMRDIKAYFCRVIIDEVDSISFFTEVKMPALTIWLISATTDLTEKSCAYSKYLKPENVIKCENAFVQKSIRIPAPKVEIHNCSNEYIEILQSLDFCGSSSPEFGLTQNKATLYALDFPEFRFKFFTKQINTAKDLLSNVFIDHAYELKTLYSSIEFSSRRGVDNQIREKMLHGVGEKLGKLPDGETVTYSRIKGLGEKSKRFEEVKNELIKISSLVKNKYCPLCAETIVSGCVLPKCCQSSVYHKNCLTDFGCPICVSKKGLECVPAKVIKPYIPGETIDKYEQLLKIIRAEKDALKSLKMLIFSDYYGTFSNIRELLTKENIGYAELSGNQIEIEKALDQFKDGSTSVLLIHSSQYGSGLNLEFSNSVLLWHKSNRNGQLIGRAQRMGRNTQLNIHHLLYKNE